MAAETAEKGLHSSKPVLYETHFEQWKEDLKKKRSEKAEGKTWSNSLFKSLKLINESISRGVGVLGRSEERRVGKD